MLPAFVTLPLTVPDPLSVPPLIATVFVVDVRVPPPATVVLPDDWVYAPLTDNVPPDAMLTVPVCVKPPVTLNVPEVTSTVPLLSRATPMPSVPVASSVPWLENVPPLLLLNGSMRPVVKFQVCCGSLMTVAPPSSTIALPLLAPWNDAVPKFSSVLPMSVTEPTPDGDEMFRMPSEMTVPLPLSVLLLFQVVVPVTLIESEPVTVPLVRVSVVMVTLDPVLKLSVPPKTPPLTETLLSVGRVVPAPKTTVPALTETTDPIVSPVPNVADPPVPVRPPVTS